MNPLEPSHKGRGPADPQIKKWKMTIRCVKGTKTHHNTRPGSAEGLRVPSIRFASGFSLQCCWGVSTHKTGQTSLGVLLRDAELQYRHRQSTKSGSRESKKSHLTNGKFPDVLSFKIRGGKIKQTKKTGNHQTLYTESDFSFPLRSIGT